MDPVIRRGDNSRRGATQEEEQLKNDNNLRMVTTQEEEQLKNDNNSRMITTQAHRRMIFGRGILDAIKKSIYFIKAKR